jgi:hypothetical protein
MRASTPSGYAARDLLGDRALGVVDDRGSAQSIQPVRVVGGAGGHHGRAAGGEQLHGVRSDAAGSALDQDDLAGLRVDGAVRSLVLDPSPRRK